MLSKIGKNMTAEKNRRGSKSWPPGDAKRWFFVRFATGNCKLGDHSGKRYHVLGQNDSGDAGKPEALKGVARFGGDFRKKAVIRFAGYLSYKL